MLRLREMRKKKRSGEGKANVSLRQQSAKALAMQFLNRYPGVASLKLSAFEGGLVFSSRPIFPNFNFEHGMTRKSNAALIIFHRFPTSNATFAPTEPTVLCGIDTFLPFFPPSKELEMNQTRREMDTVHVSDPKQGGSSRRKLQPWFVSRSKSLCCGGVFVNVIFQERWESCEKVRRHLRNKAGRNGRLGGTDGIDIGFKLPTSRILWRREKKVREKNIYIKVEKFEACYILFVTYNTLVPCKKEKFAATLVERTCNLWH